MAALCNYLNYMNDCYASDNSEANRIGIITRGPKVGLFIPNNHVICAGFMGPQNVFGIKPLISGVVLVNAYMLMQGNNIMVNTWLNSKHSSTLYTTQIHRWRYSCAGAVHVQGIRPSGISNKILLLVSCSPYQFVIEGTLKMEMNIKCLRTRIYTWTGASDTDMRNAMKVSWLWQSHDHEMTCPASKLKSLEKLRQTRGKAVFFSLIPFACSIAHEKLASMKPRCLLIVICWLRRTQAILFYQALQVQKCSLP